MEMLYSVAEAVLISFFVGAIAGGAVTAHLVARHNHADKTNEKLEVEPVKVKIDRHDN